VNIRRPASFALILIVSSSVTAQTTDRRQEAADAFVEIVKTYLAHDADRFMTLFGDSLKVINSYVDTVVGRDWLPPVEHFRTKIVKWAREAGDSTIEGYLAHHDIRVFTRDQYTLRGEDGRPGYMDTSLFQRHANAYILFAWLAAYPGGLTDDDYLVLGDVPVRDNQRGGGRAYQMILRWSPEGWKIRGMLP